MHKIHVDIMTHGGDRFYASFTFIHDPIFGKIKDEVSDAFRARFPTLKDRKDIVLFMDSPSTFLPLHRNCR